MFPWNVLLGLLELQGGGTTFIWSMIAKHTSIHTLIILNPNNMELGRLLNYAQLDEAIVTKNGGKYAY